MNVISASAWDCQGNSSNSRRLSAIAKSSANAAQMGASQPFGYSYHARSERSPVAANEWKKAVMRLKFSEGAAWREMKYSPAATRQIVKTRREIGPQNLCARS